MINSLSQKLDKLEKATPEPVKILICCILGLIFALVIIHYDLKEGPDAGSIIRYIRG